MVVLQLKTKTLSLVSWNLDSRVCHAVPCHAVPSHAMPCHAMPQQPTPALSGKGVEGRGIGCGNGRLLYFITRRRSVRVRASIIPNLWCSIRFLGWEKAVVGEKADVTYFQTLE